MGHGCHECGCPNGCECPPGGEPKRPERTEEFPITHVVVERTCFHCKGKCVVPGGQRKYGELVPCQVCDGKGRTKKSITLEEFKYLMLMSVAHKPEP